MSEPNSQQKVKILEEDLQRRQESYIRRERKLKKRVGELEDQLDAKRSLESSRHPRMRRIRDMHTQIQSNITQVQDRTATIMHEQERDLLRAFRSRLFDVQTELEKEKSKSDDGASIWIEKTRKLERELDTTRTLADRLGRENTNFAAENSRLKHQFKVQEEDREFLIRQLVACKKDNARLRQEVDGLKRNKGTNSPPPLSRPTSSHGASMQLPSRRNSVQGAAEESRYKDFVRRLKQLLETERKNVKNLRAKEQENIRNRTELEKFLRECVDDVRSNIARRRARAQNLEDVPLGDFSADDRQRVLELLLSQERVVSLLYRKTFPNAAPLETAVDVFDTRLGNMHTTVDGNSSSRNSSSRNPGRESSSNNRFPITPLGGTNALTGATIK
eukprot:TRINITY_DN22244_c0_g1_i1.p1 TRINITY_DN22244_c0_g1~~TRINITY_DN22244_c0_g1_i1.p1  ORF type:complete len:389 (-),score=91.17 TRINITY_DN22244_c0_g1_i1:133-1299(-)